MPIAFVGARKNSNRDFGSTTLPIVDAPTGLQEGDFVLLTSSADSSSNGITLPPGTTELFNGDVPSSAVGATKLAFGYQIIGETIPTDFTFTHDLDDGYAVSAIAFRGVDTDNPIDVAIDSATNDGGVIPPYPSVTTVTPSAWILSLVSIARGPLFGDMDWENFFYPPAEVTKRIDAVDSAGTGFSGHAIGSEEMVAVGTTASRSWTCIDNDDGGVAFTIALRPAIEPGAFEPGSVEIEVTATGAMYMVANFTGAATIETTAYAALGTAEPISHVETETRVSNGTGNISIDYPIGIFDGDFSLATITADNGTIDVFLPDGFTEIDPASGPLMENIILQVVGQLSGPIDGQAYASTVYNGTRSGATYLAIPSLDGVQILWQDAAGTVPAINDGDPILRLDDVSGNGLDAIQSSGSATMFLRFNGSNYWIDFTDGYDRPTIPSAAFTTDLSTVVVGIEEDLISNTVLLSTENSNAFWFVSDPGSSSTIIEVDTDYLGIRTDDGVGGMSEYTPFPTTRGDNADIYAASKVITFRKLTFDALWPNDADGAKLLGYGYETGWQPSGKFYGLAILNEDGFSSGVDRGDGTLAFTSKAGYRMLDGSEPLAVTFSHDSAESAVATLSLFRYVDPVLGPFDTDPIVYDEGGQGGAVTNDTRTTPAITTQSNGAVVIGVVTNEQATTGHTPPAGVTKIADASTGTGNDGASVAIGFETVDQAGSYPAKDWTITTSTETPYRSYSIALMPLFPLPDPWPGTALIETEATGQIAVSHRLAGSEEATAEASGSLAVGTKYEGAATIDATATASLGRKVPMSASAEIVATSQGALVMGISLEGSAVAEALATGEVGYKTGFRGSADIEVLATGDMLRGSMGKGEANIEILATGTLRPLTFLRGVAAAEGEATGSFQVKRALRARAGGDVTATATLEPIVNLVAKAVIEASVNGYILSFREVNFEGEAVIEVTATSQQIEYLATFSEDVVSIGLATIIQDFGGNAGRRTIKLNQPDRTLNVGRRSGN